MSTGIFSNSAKGQGFGRGPHPDTVIELHLLINSLVHFFKQYLGKPLRHMRRAQG